MGSGQRNEHQRLRGSVSDDVKVPQTDRSALLVSAIQER
jgi:hypothetical protein